MSTANSVPETYGLSGSEAMETLHRVTGAQLAKDSFQRLRRADGFSHCRAMAFQVVLTLIPGAVVIVALSGLMGWDTLSTAVADSVETLAPGSATDLLREAIRQGEQAGETSDWAAILAGAIALVIAGTTTFGQVERTANRLYGIERDRNSMHKYGRAFLMMVTAGALLALYLVVVGLGADGTNRDSAGETMWAVIRWPLGAVLLTAAFTIVFRHAPRRRQPEPSWLVVGSLVAVGLTLVVTLLLNVYLAGSSTFGDTYGPLAGFLGIMLWAYGVSIALFYGLAFAAQLEAVRASRPEPASEAKADLGEPDAELLSYAAALNISQEVDR